VVFAPVADCSPAEVPVQGCLLVVGYSRLVLVVQEACLRLVVVDLA